MGTRLAWWCAAASVAFAATTLALDARPDRESLLAAWEAALRAEPDTVRLEPLGNARYRFATTRFPFD